MLARLTKGAGLLALVYALSEAATLMRTVVFAHWLTPAQMGALVLMMTSLRLIEMITDVSIERLILQAKDGASAKFQTLAHGASILRGFIGGLALLLLALPIALTFDINAEGLCFLALVPVIRGFFHLDCRIYSRHLKPGGAALAEGGGALAGLIAAWPSVMITQGPEAIVLSSLAQVIVMVALSHMVARRKYRLRFNTANLKRIWNFGWPLALNALLLSAVFQGERMAVGGAYGLETLGRFGIASQLALIPALLAGRIALSGLLPAASRSRERAQGRFGLGILFTAFGLGLLFTACFALMAPGFISLLFGEHYALEAAVLAWLGAAAGARIARVGPVILLLANGDTRGVLAGSFLRAIALGLGTLLALQGMSLVHFAAIAAAGEGASLIAASLRLRHQCGMRRAIDPGLVILAASLGISAHFIPLISLNASLALVLGLLGTGLAFLKKPQWLKFHSLAAPAR
jgi:O-antigen/teichoic acid export membrane protein